MRPLPSIKRVVERLRDQGVVLPAGRVRLDCYGDSEAMSKQLLSLIRDGTKRAGTSLYWEFQAENEALPEVGDIEIVLDHNSNPALVTQLTSVEMCKFNEVTSDYAAIEGEGDGSLTYWREEHWAFFSRVCKNIGREPSNDMPVVCSVFRVLDVL